MVLANNKLSTICYNVGIVSLSEVIYKVMQGQDYLLMIYVN